MLTLPLMLTPYCNSYRFWAVAKEIPLFAQALFELVLRRVIIILVVPVKY